MVIQIPNPGDLLRLFAQCGFVSDSPMMVPLLQQAYRAAFVSDITVLLEGETGTGKQVLAHSIHSLDAKRKPFRFVTVHCSTLSETLAESELFGHQRGSFSGAIGDRAGLFTAAQRGTLFLDDVNDLPLRLQPKLLDVMQRRTVRAVGSDREATMDVRVIAAANRPLAEMVKDGTFRADLYHRLNVIRLALPPLRERKEDLTALVLAFVRRYAGLYDRIDSIDPELVRYLETCPFEGNVRELENATQRMLFLKREGSSLTLADWLGQFDTQPKTGPEGTDRVREAGDTLWRVLARQEMSFASLMRRVESDLLQRALHMKGRTRREIARHLRTSERTLYHKMKSHGLGNSQ
ncbi:MAG TPA: sigma 54-interacting transcriptional regulator [Bryobacteraceae bacterium]|nr:sigma 54-interacting transcriptional regulator [Bryobacteraceae bacterium]